MQLEQTIVDENFQEIKEHGTAEFPLAMYEDDFSRFEYGLILWHWHEEVQFTLVLEGEVHILIGNKELILAEGEGVFINSKVLHQLQPQQKDKGKVLSFILKSSIIENDMLSDAYNHCILPILNGDDYRILFSQEKRVLLQLQKVLQNKAIGYELQVKMMIGTIWHALLTRESTEQLPSIRLNSRDIERVKICIGYIHQHYRNKVTLEEIANAAHISKSELCRCFKKVLHQTPFEYLIRYRVLQAAQILKGSQLSITEIALQTGFDSISHMGRFFHKYMHQSPSQVRKFQS